MPPARGGGSIVCEKGKPITINGVALDAEMMALLDEYLRGRLADKQLDRLIAIKANEAKK